jgi:hypothetical protein
MKRKAFFVLWLLVVFGFVSVGLYAQSNEEPRLVGTWKGSSTLVFNSDGTGTWHGEPMVFGAFGGKVALRSPRIGETVYDYFFSKDGKTLILSQGDGAGYLLLKQD